MKPTKRRWTPCHRENFVSRREAIKFLRSQIRMLQNPPNPPGDYLVYLRMSTTFWYQDEGAPIQKRAREKKP